MTPVLPALSVVTCRDAAALLRALALTTTNAGELEAMAERLERVARELEGSFTGEDLDVLERAQRRLENRRANQENHDAARYKERLRKNGRKDGRREALGAIVRGKP